jgi:hypothetical protein
MSSGTIYVRVKTEVEYGYYDDDVDISTDVEEFSSIEQVIDRLDEYEQMGLLESLLNKFINNPRCTKLLKSLSLIKFNKSIHAKKTKSDELPSFIGIKFNRGVPTVHGPFVYDDEFKKFIAEYAKGNFKLYQEIDMKNLFQKAELIKFNKHMEKIKNKEAALIHSDNIADNI